MSGEEQNDQWVELELADDGYQFLADFSDLRLPPLLLDEPPPRGRGAGPDAAQVLAAAVGNCLSASLLFCLRKADLRVSGMHTRVRYRRLRNEQGRLRIPDMEVLIEPEVSAEDVSRVDRCLKLFEGFCVVTQSVRSGVRVGVRVLPRTEAAVTT